MIVEVLIFISTLFIITWIKHQINLYNKIPPGPWPIPFFGNMPVVNFKAANKLWKQYGDIFTTQVGVIRTVHIADYKICKDVFNRHELINRPQIPFFQIFEEEKQNHQCGGIIFSSNENWHNSRRFLLRHLRDLGMGKSKLEDIIVREVELLVESFKKMTDEPVFLPFDINVTILNVIWQVIAGKKFEHDNVEVKELMHKINTLQDDFMITTIPYFFPILNSIIPSRLLNKILLTERMDQVVKDYCSVIQPVIDQHTENLDPENPVDLIDEYLIEMNVNKHKEFSHFSNDDMLRTIFDLFVAGNDTTGSMVRWCILYFVKYKDEQRKIQEFIDAVVPKDTLPGLQHREELAYLDAALNEIQRLASLSSLGLFRINSADIKIGEYVVPKDTTFLPMAALIHRDPRYWTNPDDFNPENFIDKNGKFISSRDGFIPFGLGKRQCIGENFARMEIFLIMAALLQNFTFEAAEGSTIDLTPLPNPMLHKDIPQKISIKIRK